MKKLLLKIALIVVFIVSSIFATSDIGLIEIEKTALVTALAIDYDEENKDLLVSAQIAIPQETASSTSNDDAVISGRGKTIGSAIDNIGNTTGWYIKLSFCNLVILNKDVVEDRIVELVNYMIFSSNIYDSSYIACSKQPAKDVLISTSPLENITSFSVLKILLKNPGSASNVYYTKAKDIALDLSNESKSFMLPLIDIENNKNKGKEESEGKSQDTKKQLKDVVFDATETLLFKDSKIVGTLTSDETLLFNLITKSISETFFDFSYQGNTALLKAIGSKKKIEIKPNGTNASLKIKLEIQSYLVDFYDTEKKITKKQTARIIPDDMKESAEEYLRQNIISLVQKSFDTKCDFLLINENLHRYHPKFYKNNKKDFINNTSVKIDVTLKSVDKKTN